MKKAIAAAALLASGAANAQAVPSTYAMATNDDVLTVCSSQAEMDQAVCLAWIGGFLDGELGASAVSQLRVLCLPDGPDKRRQARDVIVSYLRDHAGDREVSGYAMAALYAAFPCTSPGP